MSRRGRKGSFRPIKGYCRSDRLIRLARRKASTLSIRGLVRPLSSSDTLLRGHPTFRPACSWLIPWALSLALSLAAIGAHSEGRGDSGIGSGWGTGSVGWGMGRGRAKAGVGAGRPGRTRIGLRCMGVHSRVGTVERRSIIPYSRSLAIPRVETLPANIRPLALYTVLSTEQAPRGVGGKCSGVGGVLARHTPATQRFLGSRGARPCSCLKL
jgi:hypothetical protein